MGVQEDDEESDGEWRDEFPYETNIFSLSNYYNIEGRVATNKDAVVYKATVRKTGLFSSSLFSSSLFSLLLSSPLLTPLDSPHSVFICLYGINHSVSAAVRICDGIVIDMVDVSI